MDSDLPSPNQESNETKAEFRKPTNDAAHRKYRRHSPIAESSDEDGGPKRGHKSRIGERRNDDRVEDRRSSRNQHGRDTDSYRHSSRGREARGDTHFDSRGRDREFNKPRDHYRDVDRYSRDRSDVPARKYKDSSSDRTYDGRHGSRYEDRDKHARGKDRQDDNRDSKSSRDHRSDGPSSYKDCVGRRSKWETGGAKDSDVSCHAKDSDENGLDRAVIKAEERSACASESFATKRPKLFSSEETEIRKDETPDFKVVPKQTVVNGSDAVTNMDAAKVAAIEAAKLVNKNLTTSGIMTADQKKKLLWGKKKSTSADETSNRWDSTMFSDRERQEKFNKLMGVKGDVKVNSKLPSGQDAEKLELDLEKQYSAGLRRRDGRTVGLGL